MQTFLIKTYCLLMLLFFALVCKAEEMTEPVKFYDDLIEKAKELSRYYTVKKNETLSVIAARYGYNPVELARWNQLSAPYTLVVGQRLKLFNPQENVEKKASKQPSTQHKSPALKSDGNTSKQAKVYVVKKDETLFSIAKRFSVPVAQLASWNGITSPSQLYVGQTLKIFKDKQKHSDLKNVKNSVKTTENLRDFSQKTSIISINNKSMLKFYCEWPTEGKIIKNFSQSHGRGIEISGKLGQHIKAIAAGRVVAISPGIYGHGGFIVIQHKDQYLSSYTNNRRALVKNGQIVTAGQVIAEMGRVGRKRPSLELEIRKNGKLVDPMWFLPKKK